VSSSRNNRPPGTGGSPAAPLDRRGRRSPAVDVRGAALPRRAFVAGLVGLLVTGTASGHTPYKQWVVYRKRHLLIATDRSTDGSYALGKKLAAALKNLVPDSRARVARAPDNRRIASLLATAQFDVALLPRDEAIALARGEQPFANYGPVDLRTLYVSGRYILVSRADFPLEHAYLVTEALVQRFGLDRTATFEAGIPVHSGSAEFLGK
jgi:hypothetical protein